jgi:hypothetical protein
MAVRRWAGRIGVAAGVAAVVMALGSAAALACGGLVAPGHAEVLERATTLAAWHAGMEHYVTGFRFAGSADHFGYIVPLPGVPVKIQKAGDWTLERLEREVNPAEKGNLAVPLAAAARDASVQVLQQVRIDALDITVVRGGGRDVAAWAARNGFDLTPDTPTVLGRYSDDGAVFALARFDRPAEAKKGLIEGQGTVIHFTIPTKAPWIPLRILALGKAGAERVDADLFVLTDQAPALAPAISDLPGMTVRADGPASTRLLSDLRSDRGMRWLPASGMWFTALSYDTTASTVRADLSIDGGPFGPVVHRSSSAFPWAPWAVGAVLVLGAAMVANGRRPRLRLA